VNILKVSLLVTIAAARARDLGWMVIQEVAVPGVAVAGEETAWQIRDVMMVHSM
jgi:hypothetical protein